MHVQGVAKDNNYILTATAAELLKIQGKDTPVVAGMFKAGQRIEVAEVWKKLAYFKDKAAQLRTLVAKLRQTADNIEAALPEE